MGNEALYDAPITCPRCTRTVQMPWPLSFQWGRVPRREPRYQVGQGIEWLRGKNAEVLPPYVAITTPAKGLFGVPQVSFNVGEPNVPELYALEADLTLVEGTEGTRCPHCAAEWATWGAHVVDGVLRGARGFTREEIARTGTTLDEMNLLTVRADGSWWPRTDWFLVPLTPYRG